jgi:hypothetical protein
MALSGATPDKWEDLQLRRKQRLVDERRIGLDEEKFAFERANPGLEIKETPQGLVAVDKRTGAARSVTLDGQTIESKDSPEYQAKVAGAKKEAELNVQSVAEQAARKRGATQVLSALDITADKPDAEDRISTLIQKSTGGLVQRGVSENPRAVGLTTSGRQAISEPETLATSTTLDLLSGKVGAGISNADRDFFLATLGDIANPNKPAQERLAAWNQAKMRLMRMSRDSEKFSTPAAAPVVMQLLRKATFTFLAKEWCRNEYSGYSGRRYGHFSGGNDAGSNSDCY